MKNDINTQDMIELTAQEKLEQMLNMMDDIDRVCKIHKLKYFIAYGTLIGAIRHNGIIPWDDDIDIQMPRDDYEKFISIYSKEGRYQITSPKSSDPLYYYAKVYNADTLKLESGVSYRKRKPLGIDIDIFPLDNYCGVRPKGNRMPNKRSLQLLYYLRMYAIDDITSKKSRKYPLLSYLLGVVSHIIGNKAIIGIFEQIAKFGNKSQSDYYTVYSGMTNISIFQKTDFESCLNIPFENRFYNVPVGYDNILRSSYGDYMALPPKEKRVSHHLNKVFWKK